MKRLFIALKLLLLHQSFQVFMAAFGYVKIPKEAIELAQELETGYRYITDKFPSVPQFQAAYEISKTLTNFLRSGRLISYGKE
jgi:hypothetical protein